MQTQTHRTRRMPRGQLFAGTTRAQREDDPSRISGRLLRR